MSDKMSNVLRSVKGINSVNRRMLALGWVCRGSYLLVRSSFVVAGLLLL